MPIYRSVDTAIAAVVENRVSIVKLQTGAPIGAQIIDLVDALKANTSLKKLALDGQCIGAEGADSIAEYLALNPRLEHISLFNNSVGPAGAARIAASLATNRRLADLDLGDNAVGDSGAAAFADALRQNRAVSYIRLHNDGIGPAGAAALADMLGKVYTLEEICLYGNAIGDAGAASIGAALGRAAGLAELDIGDNKIGDEGVLALGAGLAGNTSLEQLSIASNPFGVRGVAYLALLLLRGRGKIERRVKGVPWHLLLQQFSGTDASEPPPHSGDGAGDGQHAPTAAVAGPATGAAGQQHAGGGDRSAAGHSGGDGAAREGEQGARSSSNRAASHPLLPASLDPGREADPHCQRANKAVLRYLLAMEDGERKAALMAALGAYLDLCAAAVTSAAAAATAAETPEPAEQEARAGAEEQTEKGDLAAPTVPPASQAGDSVALVPASPVPAEAEDDDGGDGGSGGGRRGEDAAVIQRAWRRRWGRGAGERVRQRTQREQAARRIQQEVRRKAERRQEQIILKQEEEKKAVERVKMESVIGNILNCGFRRVVKRKREVSLAKLTQAVGALDGQVFAEIKSFKEPPDQVFLVMKAVLLLLGHGQRELADWRRCVVLIGQTGKLAIRRRINLFRLDDLAGDRTSAVAQAEQIFAACDWKEDVDAVHEINRGAGIFFAWVRGVVKAAKQQQEQELQLRQQGQQQQQQQQQPQKRPPGDGVDADV